MKNDKSAQMANFRSRSRREAQPNVSIPRLAREIISEDRKERKEGVAANSEVI